MTKYYVKLQHVDTESLETTAVCCRLCARLIK